MFSRSLTRRSENEELDLCVLFGYHLSTVNDNLYLVTCFSFISDSVCKNYSNCEKLNHIFIRELLTEDIDQLPSFL